MTSKPNDLKPLDTNHTYNPSLWPHITEGVRILHDPDQGENSDFRSIETKDGC